jgi:hypothetical protein
LCAAFFEFGRMIARKTEIRTYQINSKKNGTTTTTNKPLLYSPCMPP